MIATVVKNWEEIKRVMILSQTSEYNWLEYSQKITNGLSNNVLTKRGCGDVIWFVERLNEYSHLPSEYLSVAKKMTEEQIQFIEKHREFLNKII